MKNIKKLFAMLLTFIMVFGMTATAFAAETYSITIENEATGHTYEAYQIFKGDLAIKDKKAILSNIEWGTGVTEAGKTAMGDAALKAETLETTADAAAFAKVVAPYLNTVAGTSTFTAPKNYVISGLEPGYYLVKDKNDTITGDDTYTEYILKVVENVKATPKGDKPEVEKKVDDEYDSDESEDGKDWQDSADYDIGDKVPFKLTGTLPTNYAEYDSYTYIFHDVLSQGLTYNGDAKVYVVNGTEKTEVTESFKIATTLAADQETNLTIGCDDLKAIEGVTIDKDSKIVVEYTATLNENANIGSLGNPNEVCLEYSNNPNNDGQGDTGVTPEDKVIVFTFKVIVNKVDENQKPLVGAEFKLEKKQADGTWKTINVTTVKDETIFNFEGLDDGQYRLIESKTPDGYNTIDPIYFVVTAEHDVTSDDPELTNLVVKITDEDGNILADADSEFTVDLGQGSMTTTIVNQSGAELPSTGGMGTTIFYVLGFILVAGAAILLITKKRMSGIEK